jgi:hypothetical protein
MATVEKLSEYESPEHEEKATALLAELGRFIVAFERVCVGMRGCIYAAFHKEGLRNQGLSQVIVNGQAAAALRTLLGAIFAELKDQDEDDKACVKSLLKEIEALAARRNSLMHAEWHLNYDYEGATDEFYALAHKPSTSQRNGACDECIDVNKDSLTASIEDAKRAQVLLRRLCYCLAQKGFKVSTEFARSM